ncbi:MAG TPA: hypothetical protein VMM58_04120 [Bacteroidota bacterium]|nr:hypothetical protein [Bacteroidota bacterium]
MNLIAYRSLRANQSLKLMGIVVDISMRAKQPVTCWTGLVSRGRAPSLRRFAAAA